MLLNFLSLFWSVFLLIRKKVSCETVAHGASCSLLLLCLCQYTPWCLCQDQTTQGHISQTAFRREATHDYLRGMCCQGCVAMPANLQLPFRWFSKVCVLMQACAHVCACVSDMSINLPSYGSCQMAIRLKGEGGSKTFSCLPPFLPPETPHTHSPWGQERAAGYACPDLKCPLPR